jgi:hypothetical protein
LAFHARRFPAQAVEPHQEAVTLDSSTVSGVVEWLSNDPIGISGGLNQYVFCNNNPVNFRDPFGLCADSRYSNRSQNIAGARGFFNSSGWISRVLGNLVLDAMDRANNTVYQAERSGMSPSSSMNLAAVQFGGEMAAGSAVANAGGLVTAQGLGGLTALIPVVAASAPAASHLDTLERTAHLLEMIRTGQGQQASQIIQAMGNSSAGRSELFRIHQQVSRILPYATSPQAANVMKTIQDLSGTFSRGGN